MSDGYADMIEYYRALFEELMETLVLNVELYAKKNWAEAEMHLRKIIKMQDLYASALGCPTSLEANNLSGNAAKVFIKRMQFGRAFFHSDTLYILQSSKQFARLMRFQRATEFSDKLLVIADEKWQILPNGIHYEPPLEFHDGQQDMLLGIAKLRAEKLGLIRGKPMMIVAKWHYSKRYKLLKVWQP